MVSVPNLPKQVLLRSTSSCPRPFDARLRVYGPYKDILHPDIWNIQHSDPKEARCMGNFVLSPWQNNVIQKISWIALRYESALWFARSFAIIWGRLQIKRMHFVGFTPLRFRHLVCQNEVCHSICDCRHTSSQSDVLQVCPFYRYLPKNVLTLQSWHSQHHQPPWQITRRPTVAAQQLFHRQTWQKRGQEKIQTHVSPSNAQCVSQPWFWRKSEQHRETGVFQGSRAS